MTPREALTDDRPRPSGARKQVLALSPEQRTRRRANQTKQQMAQAELRRSYETLGDAIDNFRWFDITGHPEDWLPQAVEALDALFSRFLDFQREVNAVVARDPYFAAVRERQNLERIELHKSRSAGAVLEDALRLSEGASVEAARVVRRMIHAVDYAEVDLLDGKPVGKNETRPGVVQNNVTHAEDATSTADAPLDNAASGLKEGR